ncbi:MAG: sigma-70 family RNA polymerase sigma factor [Candidatus Roizmanbacteria bacterium]|nr:sigma-70 family RNA polymerase sigma factor [Candidatus Roizmanbacteria bacterium]
MSPELPHEDDAKIAPSEQWKHSNIEPLIRVIPQELGITPDGIARFDRFLCGFGTSEGKMATLLSLLHTYPQTVQEIHRSITEPLTEKVWFPAEAAMRKAYLDDALVPTGLAARIKEGWRVYFEATDEGEYPAKIVAANMLYDAATHQRSWKDVLGQTTSPSDSRSHVNRIAILFSLMQGLSHEAGIAEATDITDSVIGNNIRTLSAQGLVHYDSVTTTGTQGWVSYRRIGNLEDVLHQATRNRLRRNIVRYFTHNEVGNAKTIAQAVGRRDETDMINVLSELVNAGVLERIDYHGAVKQSDAEITPEGQALLDLVLVPSLHVCSGAEPDTRMKVIQQEVEGNPNIITRALQLFQQTASGFNKQSAEQRIQRVMDFIREHGPARYKQMINQLGSSAGHALRELTNLGQLCKHQDEKAVFYYIPGEQEPPAIEKTRIVYQYEQPVELVPLGERKKEEYHADLETPEFWLQLAKNLESMPEGITESIFYRFYRTGSPDWIVRDDFKSGDYSNFISALRKLGITKPYEYIRSYIPHHEETRSVARDVQQRISEVLISRLKDARYEKGVEQLESPEFWDMLQRDLTDFEPGLSFRSFIVHYTRDNRRAAEINESRDRVQGDHRLLMSWFISHFETLRGLPELNPIPPEFTENPRFTMTTYLYLKSPESVRQLLLEKFPDDFSQIAQVDFKLIESKDESVREQAQRRLLAIISHARSIGTRITSMNVKPYEMEQIQKVTRLGEQAKEHLANNYEIIVQRIAGKFAQRGIDWHDAVQEGQLGLLKAMENFDRSSSKKFVAYAITYVQGYIQHALEGARNVVKRRSSIQKITPAVLRARNELTQDDGTEPTAHEIAEHLNIPVAHVIEVFQSSQYVPSLQDPIAEGEETELGDLIEDPTSHDPSHLIEQQETNQTIFEALQKLTKRERRLIELHFNLGGEGEHSLESVRKQWNMKRKDIQDLLNKALGKMQRYLNKKSTRPS